MIGLREVCASSLVSAASRQATGLGRTFLHHSKLRNGFVLSMNRRRSYRAARMRRPTPGQLRQKRTVCAGLTKMRNPATDCISFILLNSIHHNCYDTPSRRYQVFSPAPLTLTSLLEIFEGLLKSSSFSPIFNFNLDAVPRRADASSSAG